MEPGPDGNLLEPGSTGQRSEQHSRRGRCNQRDECPGQQRGHGHLDLLPLHLHGDDVERPGFLLQPSHILHRGPSILRGSLIRHRALGVATTSCPSYSAFVSLQGGCVVPLWGQYVGWLENALAGNWGLTLLPGISGTDTTWHVFFSRFPYTAELAIAGAFLTIIIG